MPDRIAGKRGMRTFRREAVSFKLKNYLITDKLPQLPKGGFGHVSRHPPGSGWGMLANDQYGCCVLAGAGHEEMHWATSTHKPLPDFTDAVIAKQYLNLTGGEDTGLDPVATASMRRSVGLKDANGKTYKLKAYALIDTLEELAYAAYLFNAAGVGFYLPQSAEMRFSKHLPWDETSDPPQYDMGHYVPIIGKNSVGLWIGVTWGALQGISDDFIQKYSFSAGGGGLAYFSENYLLDSGETPESFDEAQLDADLAAIPNLPKGG
jgi:hypothetical protein